MKIFNYLIIGCLALIFTQCKSDNTPKAEIKEAAKTTAKISGTKYLIDKENSKVYWTGSKLAGDHTGTFNLSEGELAIDNGVITGGKFVIDINSLTVTDLSGGPKAKLEGHLKSADFFEVENHAASNFEIVKVSKIEKDPNANTMVYGNLTLKGVTKEIGIKAQVYANSKSVTVTTGKFDINRTDFNLKYGSASFFDGLKDKAINDEVGIQLKIKAIPQN